MAYDPEESLGYFFGFGTQSRKILADTEGFFGWSAGRSTNLIINLVPPAGLRVRQPLTLTLSWQGGGQSIDYDPSFDLQRTVPTNTLITLSTVNSWYEPVTLTFTVPVGVVVPVTVPLVFASAYTYAIRHQPV